MAVRVFISYRRGDGGAFPELLHTNLRRWLGPRGVFLDEPDMRPGEFFWPRIESEIRAANVVLVLIGPDWKPDRLSDPWDWVRREIALALDEPGKVVIPLLVEGVTAIPPLPDPIASLAQRQAFEFGRPRRLFFEELRRAICAAARSRGVASLWNCFPIKIERARFATRVAIGLPAVVLISLAMLLVRSPWPRTPPVSRTTTTTARVHEVNELAPETHGLPYTTGPRDIGAVHYSQTFAIALGGDRCTASLDFEETRYATALVTGIVFLAVTPEAKAVFRVTVGNHPPETRVADGQPQELVVKIDGLPAHVRLDVEVVDCQAGARGESIWGQPRIPPP